MIVLYIILQLVAMFFVLNENLNFFIYNSVKEKLYYLDIEIPRVQNQKYSPVDQDQVFYEIL